MPTAKLLLLLMVLATDQNDPVIQELRYFTAAARAPRMRGIGEFAEEEITLGEGPFAGRRFSTARQPFGRLLFNEIDSGRWRRHAVTGCVQAGKSLKGYVIPALWHLFEHKETVIMGLPTMDMAGDKWRNEMLPVIERSRYRNLLPSTGSGSRGGTPTAIRFNHGVELKFMGAHGGDEMRSSYTSRVLVATEVDKYDTAGEASREAPPIRQMEARLESFGDAGRSYFECTVSIEQGCIWQEYTNGSKSQILTPCVHCGAHVAIEREHFVGWEHAKTEMEAGKLGHFHCPSCGEAISDADRRTMNGQAVLVHAGQSVEIRGRGRNRRPVVVGELPETETLGFRWSAFHNLFWTSKHIARKEWLAKRTADPEEGERERKQFAWCQPVESDTTDEFDLDPYLLSEQVTGIKRGEVPENTERLTVGVDIGSKRIHWIMLAWLKGGTVHVVDYGKLHVYQGMAQRKGIEAAIRAALKHLRDDVLAPGFPVVNSAQRRRPDMVWVDCGWKSAVIYRFIAECDALARQEAKEKEEAAREAGRNEKHEPRFWWMCVAGRGWAKQYGGKYSHPKNKTRVLRIIGEQYHFVRDPEHGIRRGLVNADYWKSWFHARLATTPADQKGREDEEDGELRVGYVTLPLIADGDHSELTRHWTSEKETRTWDPDKGGEITQWETVSRANHWFDASYLASGAGHLVGVRIDAPTKAPIDRPPAGQWFTGRRRK